MGGRVPLPLYTTRSNFLAPDIWLTPLCNRHYVVPQLRSAVKVVSLRLARQSPSIRIQYLDANFPFLDGFPMFPHLSHDDGEKLDLAFLYYDPNTGKTVDYTPALLGYGVSEQPKGGEVDIPHNCRDKGYWQYNWLYDITPQVKHDSYVFDTRRTREMITKLAAEEKIKKIFIEPHLKNRLQLDHIHKVRFHGCHSIRHDDHIHLEM